MFLWICCEPEIWFLDRGNINRCPPIYLSISPSGAVVMRCARPRSLKRVSRCHHRRRPVGARSRTLAFPSSQLRRAMLDFPPADLFNSITFQIGQRTAWLAGWLTVPMDEGVQFVRRVAKPPML